MYIFSEHQEKQREVINLLEQQIKTKALGFSNVVPVEDYETDNRICLTSVHLPHQELITKVQNKLITPLKTISPSYFFYSKDSLHMTIKNIRVINDPPHFTNKDIEKAKQVFDLVIPRHRKFTVYFYRLLLFPNSLALVGTTDSEFDSLIFDLDKELDKVEVSDDKKYVNPKYFFSNITLARFNRVPSKGFIEEVEKLSKSIFFSPYMVDSVTLVTCSAVFMKKNIIKTWKLLD